MDWLISLLPLAYTDAVVVVGGAVLGASCGILSAFAVLRHRALVGDAIAHSVLPGVCVAFMITGTKDPRVLLVGAAVAAGVAALLMLGIERRSTLGPDGAIGVVVCGAFALGVVLLSHIASSGDANQAGLQNYLFGQAAGLLAEDVAVMAGLACVALAVVVPLFRALKTTLFDPGFARSTGLPVRVLEVVMTCLLTVAVLIGVRMVGAILMVAMLVVPTVTARRFAGRLSLVLVLGAVVGAGIGVAGSLVSVRAELPTGPVIVLIGAAVAMIAVLPAPGRGSFRKALRRDAGP